jgi:DNA invertase Pin-like site-specific DNA recombinase
MAKKAIAYYRTSSAANVGEDKDSLARQRAAVESYAKRAGYVVVDMFYDAAVSGADPVDARPGLADALARIAGNGVKTIIVETANRFARDLIVQETGWRYLQSLGIELIAADSPGAFLDDTPTAVLIRQVLGAVAQFEKAALVAKLKGARQRKRATGVKVEGRKSYAESKPEVVAIARRLAREPLDGRRRTLRDVSAELAAQGHVTKTDKPYAPTAVGRMIDQAGGKRRRA